MEIVNLPILQFLRELAEQTDEHIVNSDPVSLIEAFHDINARHGANGRPVFIMPQNAFEFTLGFITALLQFNRLVPEAPVPPRPRVSLFHKS